jgi:hypothetical protein
VLGCTLWTDYHNKVAEDHYGSNLKPGIVEDRDEHTRMHRIHRSWLEERINCDDRDKIIVTHYVPTPKLIESKYAVSPRFCTNLEWMMGGHVRGWVCGHTHSYIRTNVKGTQCVVNANTGKLDVLFV